MKPSFKASDGGDYNPDIALVAWHNLYLYFLCCLTAISTYIVQTWQNPFMQFLLLVLVPPIVLIN